MNFAKQSSWRDSYKFCDLQEFKTPGITKWGMLCDPTHYEPQVHKMK